MHHGPMRLRGKTAAVTGASSGLGAAIARALADEGAAVVGYARRFDGAPGVPAAGAIRPVKLDVSHEAAVAAAFVASGPIDALINCAGDGRFGPIAETDVADLRAMLDVHIVGAFLCARELLRQPRPAHPRHVVNISSVVAFRAFPDCGAYTAAKEGLRGFTRVLVEEARALDVRVTGFYPGAIDTPIWDSRPDFDRGAMLAPQRVAALVVDVLCRPELAIEEILVMPPAGAL